MSYADGVAAIRQANPALAERLAGFRTLEHILEWAASERLLSRDLDIIAQDEYCHDMLLPLGTEWLSFGMT